MQSHVSPGSTPSAAAEPSALQSRFPNVSVTGFGVPLVPLVCSPSAGESRSWVAASDVPFTVARSRRSTTWSAGGRSPGGEPEVVGHDDRPEQPGGVEREDEVGAGREREADPLARLHPARGERRGGLASGPQELRVGHPVQRRPLRVGARGAREPGVDQHPGQRSAEALGRRSSLLPRCQSPGPRRPRTTTRTSATS